MCNKIEVALSRLTYKIVLQIFLMVTSCFISFNDLWKIAFYPFLFTILMEDYISKTETVLLLCYNVLHVARIPHVTVHLLHSLSVRFY